MATAGISALSTVVVIIPEIQANLPTTCESNGAGSEAFTILTKAAGITFFVAFTAVLIVFLRVDAQFSAEPISFRTPCDAFPFHAELPSRAECTTCTTVLKVCFWVDAGAITEHSWSRALLATFSFYTDLFVFALIVACATVNTICRQVYASRATQDAWGFTGFLAGIIPDSTSI